MKVLFLIRSLNYGGAERQVTLLAKGLRKRGHDVAVAVFYPSGPLERELQEADVPVRSLDKRGRWDLPGCLVRLLRLIGQERPDVVHGYLFDPNLLALLTKSVHRSVKVVWGVRSATSDVEEDWMDRASFWLNRRLAPYADAIIVNSRLGFRFLERHGYPTARMTVIPNGVDTDRFAPDSAGRRRLRDEWGIEDSDRLVGVVGRLNVVKDHPTFLRAAASLRQGRPNVKFICIGNGSDAYRAELTQLACRLGIFSAVTWEPAREDLAAVYSALDVAVSSSYSESFSNVIVEAMACGTPCVVTDVGDSSWIVGGQGRVVPPRDPGALAHAVGDALDDRSRSSDRIRDEILGRFSASRLVEQTEQLLGGLLSRPSQPFASHVPVA